MVGHTGDFKAAIKAVETIDNCLEAIVPIALKENYVIIIIADHGNSDYMINEDGSPNTAHTTNPVPVIIIDPEQKINRIENGILANIAPTILKILSIKPPEEMTAKSLI
jgi:2,3-bisphosphoglycerate-independent phosphoglycerate mutase